MSYQATYPVMTPQYTYGAVQPYTYPTTVAPPPPTPYSYQQPRSAPVITYPVAQPAYQAVNPAPQYVAPVSPQYPVYQTPVPVGYPVSQSGYYNRSGYPAYGPRAYHRPAYYSDDDDYYDYHYGACFPRRRRSYR